MSWASYEDMMAEVPVITAEEIFCIECETRTPEPGCDHCEECLKLLGEAAWERQLENYYGGSSMTQRERIKHDRHSYGSLK